MNTKLTLRLNEDLIGRAKRYSERSGKSASQLVADYFSLLEPEEVSVEPPITPRVQALIGALKGGDGDESAYRSYLESKYK